MLRFFHFAKLQAAPFDEQAAAGFSLAIFFGVRGCFRHFMVRAAPFRVNPDHTDREGGHGDDE
jgi:hypothetical protein